MVDIEANFAENDRVLNALELQCYKIVRSHLSKIFRRVKNVAVNQSLSAANNELVNIRYNDFEQIYFEIYNKVGYKMATLEFKRIQEQKRSGLNFFDIIWQGYIKSALADISITAKITAVTNKTKNLLRAILQQAADNRLAPLEIARLFRENEKSFTKKRALTIARTEMTNAAAIGAEFAAKQYTGTSQLYKIWNHYAIGDFRENHKAVNKKFVKVGLDFTVGGQKMSKPGDPRGGASEVINCRCNISHATEDVLKEMGWLKGVLD